MMICPCNLIGRSVIGQWLFFLLRSDMTLTRQGDTYVVPLNVIPPMRIVVLSLPLFINIGTIPTCHVYKVCLVSHIRSHRYHQVLTIYIYVLALEKWLHEYNLAYFLINGLQQYPRPSH